MMTAHSTSPGHADSDLNRYLQFTYSEIGPNMVVACQPVTLCSRDSADPEIVDRRALFAVTDHVMGLALHAALDLKGPLATVDLKMEILGQLSPGPVFVRVPTPPPLSSLAFVVAHLDQGDEGRPFAQATARFMVGAWPGGGDAAFPPPLTTPVNLHGITDFATYAGLPVNSPISFEVAPHERTVGARAVPAFHGGIVGAALQTAACNLALAERGPGATLVSLSVEYGRAAMATEPLHIRAQVARMGRRLLRIQSTASQGQDRVVSQAQTVFLIEDR